MSRRHEHDELRAILSVVTPETLPAEQIDRMLRHADDCHGCATELREFAARAVLAQTPAVRLDPSHAQRLRTRIVGRLAPEPAPTVGAARSRTHHAVARRGGGVGWMAAAALAVALLTHHGFHQPLSSGWLAAAGFAFVALGLGIYAVTQRRRLMELRDQLNSPESGRMGHAPER